MNVLKISDEENLKVQKEEFEKQPLMEEYLHLLKEWERVYCRLIRALADAIGEEEVFDIVEKTWWDLAYEAGRSWREMFDEAPETALMEKARSWHESPMWARFCCCDVPILKGDHWELLAVKCYREIFREMNEPEIGIMWCLTDFAAVKGWSPKVIMRQPKNMLRGDNYCHQIRKIVDDPNLQWDYSKELSEKAGWRSIKKLKEMR